MAVNVGIIFLLNKSKANQFISYDKEITIEKKNATESTFFFKHNSRISRVSSLVSLGILVIIISFIAVHDTIYVTKKCLY